MGKSTFISAALHVAILLFALVAFPAAKMDGGPLVAIPVDLATPSAVTKVKAGMKDAKDDAPLAGKTEPPKPKAVKEKSDSAQPEDTASIAEKPKEPDPSEAKKTAEKPKNDPAAQEQAEQKNPVKQAKTDTPKKHSSTSKTRGFSTDRIAALLNKIPDAADEPDPIAPAAEKTPVQGQSSGTEMTMSANEIDALRGRIADCWSPPPGGLGADEIVVKLRLRLNQDGTLIGYPTVTNSSSSPFFQAAADSAVRAVYQCQPYQLPIAKYALWRDMILNFDPSEMYRG
jgi:outer membrane biosynthesis protein TonB